MSYNPLPINPEDALERKALAFHQANPHILPAILDVCLDMHDVGWKRWSINAAFEVVRFQAQDESMALNNNHRAFFARWIMRDFPVLAGFFATRRQQLEDVS